MVKRTSVRFHHLLASSVQGVTESEPRSSSRVGLVCCCQGLGTTRTSVVGPSASPGTSRGSKGHSCRPAHSTGVQSATLPRRRSPETACSGSAAVSVKKWLVKRRAVILLLEPAPRRAADIPLVRFQPGPAEMQLALGVGTAPVLCRDPASSFQWPRCSGHPPFPPIGAAQRAAVLALGALGVCVCVWGMLCVCPCLACCWLRSSLPSRRRLLLAPVVFLALLWLSPGHLSAFLFSAPRPADALPPFEGAPLVRRGSVAQTRLLFPAAESCQPWLPSQKAAPV